MESMIDFYFQGEARGLSPYQVDVATAWAVEIMVCEQLERDLGPAWWWLCR